MPVSLSANITEILSAARKHAPYQYLIILDKMLASIDKCDIRASAEGVSGQCAVPQTGEIAEDSAGFKDVSSADEIPKEDLAQMEEAVAETVKFNVELRGMDAEEEGTAVFLMRSLVFSCWRLGRCFPPPLDLRSDAWCELNDDIRRAHENARKARVRLDCSAANSQNADSIT